VEYLFGVTNEVVELVSVPSIHLGKRAEIPEPPGVWKVRPMHVPAVQFGAVAFARQPCSDLHYARILAVVMIHPSRQGCFIVSKFS